MCKFDGELDTSILTCFFFACPSVFRLFFPRFPFFFCAFFHPHLLFFFSSGCAAPVAQADLTRAFAFSTEPLARTSASDVRVTCTPTNGSENTTSVTASSHRLMKGVLAATSDAWSAKMKARVSFVLLARFP